MANVLFGKLAFVTMLALYEMLIIDHAVVVKVGQKFKCYDVAGIYTKRPSAGRKIRERRWKIFAFRQMYSSLSLLSPDFVVLLVFVVVLVVVVVRLAASHSRMTSRPRHRPEWSRPSSSVAE